jgi:cell division protein FtsN
MTATSSPAAARMACLGRGVASGQRGGFALGLVVGLLIGLVLALGVALFVTKAPVPFINKVPQRTAEQDAAEAERNRNWNPNAPLTGPGAARPAAPAGTAASAVPQAAASKPVAAAASKPVANPAAILSGSMSPGSAGGAASAAVLPARKAGEDPFVYFIQAGAFTRPEDAESQRARIALLGAEAKITEREQSGRTVYRVRLGPYKTKPEADAASEKLAGAGVEAALVRVDRPPQ